MDLYLHSLNTASWRGAVLKHRDFTFLPLPYLSHLRWSRRLGCPFTRTRKRCHENSCKVDLRETLWGWRVDGTGPGSCPVAGSGVNDVKLWVLLL